MPDRFFVPEPFDAPESSLDGGEAHHLLHVLRAKPGDVIELFDGRGASARATIVETLRRSVRVRIDERRRDDPARTPPLTVAAPLPKGDRGRTLIEKLTELGVERFVPLRTRRSVVEPGDGKRDKLQQTVIAACKQSGRNTLLDIAAPQTWTDFVANEFENRLALVADPTGDPLRSTVTDLAHESRAIVIAVGPEGGFDADELAAAKDAGARLVRLGPTILRIETAAIALAATVRLWRDGDA